MDTRTPWTAPVVRPLVEAADARIIIKNGQFGDGPGYGSIQT